MIWWWHIFNKQSALEPHPAQQFLCQQSLDLGERDKILLLVSFSWDTLRRVESRACAVIAYSYLGLSCGHDFLNKGLVSINNVTF